VVEFYFDSMEDAGKYSDPKELGPIFQGQLPAHGTNIHIAAPGAARRLHQRCSGPTLDRQLTGLIRPVDSV
jgi:hypothetical protein